MSIGLKVVLAVIGGFVLIAFIGILAALLIPNFLDALQMAKQKRTLADFRDVGIALNAYALDNGQFPDVTTIAALSAALEPDYLEAMPRTDGWERPFVYRCGSGPWGSEGCQGFRLVSAGRDGVFEFDDPWSYEAGLIERGAYDEDLVMATEGPLREPAPR
ncbi:MAG: type II secretion system protein GspG [Acidobacteriota bacterium]